MQRYLLQVRPCSQFLLSRQYSSSTSKQNGVVKNIWNWMAQQYHKTPGYSGYHLFRVAKEQGTNELWYSRGLVSDDFRSKQLLIVMHVWMIHKRLLQEGKRGLLIQECLFDLLWDDTSVRIHEQGVGDFMLSKYLKKVQQYSFSFCISLDRALEASLGRSLEEERETNDEHSPTDLSNTLINGTLQSAEVESKIRNEISGVLWKSLFLENENLKDQDLLGLANYVRREQLALQSLSSDDLFYASIPWGPIPEKGGVAGLKGMWQEASAPDGKIYYWNTVTKETTWEKPTK